MSSNLTDSQKHEVMHALYRSTYADIFKIISEDKWTEEMFVYFWELVREGKESIFE